MTGPIGFNGESIDEFYANAKRVTEINVMLRRALFERHSLLARNVALSKSACSFFDIFSVEPDELFSEYVNNGGMDNSAVKRAVSALYRTVFMNLGEFSRYFCVGCEFDYGYGIFTFLLSDGTRNFKIFIDNGGVGVGGDATYRMHTYRTETYCGICAVVSTVEQPWYSENYRQSMSSGYVLSPVQLCEYLKAFVTVGNAHDFSPPLIAGPYQYTLAQLKNEMTYYGMEIFA